MSDAPRLPAKRSETSSREAFQERAEILARFIDAWEMPRPMLQGKERVALLMRVTRDVPRNDLVNALNALFASGSAYRPSASQIVHACAQERYRRLRRAGVPHRLTEAEYVQKRITQLPTDIQLAIDRLEAGSSVA